jgi:hypothetical protein
MDGGQAGAGPREQLGTVLGPVDSRGRLSPDEFNAAEVRSVDGRVANPHTRCPHTCTQSPDGSGFPSGQSGSISGS